MSCFFFVKCNVMILLWFNFIPGLNILFLFWGGGGGAVLFDNDFETKYEQA